MKKSRIFFGLFTILFTYNLLLSQSSFRMISYNLLQYDGSERNEHLRTVIDWIDPDLIIVQEIESQVAVDSLYPF